MIKVDIRWMIRRDMPEVLEIERHAFPEHPWSEEDFMACLRQRNCVGMVAERDEEIVGYMIYELNKTDLHVLNFAVDRSIRRNGIGRQMCMRLAGKLSQQRRTKIHFELSERNLTAQKFLRSQGYLCREIYRGYYDTTDDDAYRFTYELADRATMDHEFAQGRGIIG